RGLRAARAVYRRVCGRSSRGFRLPSAGDHSLGDARLNDGSDYQIAAATILGSTSDPLVDEAGKERRVYDELPPLRIKRAGRLGVNCFIERPALLPEPGDVIADRNK